MAETIASLGGVPLGRAGTGTAVILGEKDYSYLKPKEVKAEKYKPLVSDSEVEKLLKEAGTVWRPDQKEAKEKFDAIYTKIKQIELHNKAGEKEAAKKLYDELVNDKFEFANFLKNSKIEETNGLQYENDREKQSLLYDDEDDINYQAWLAKPVAQRELNPPIQRASDLNYPTYAINNMNKLMVPDKDTDVRDKGGFRNTQTNVYYTEDKVRDASRQAAYNMSGKYMNYWKQKMLAKAVDDDPTTPEDEKELAAQIVANLPPGGQSPELYEFIANQNYMLFSGRMERVEKKTAPAPAPKTGGRGGAGGKEPTVAVTTGKRTLDVFDVDSGALVKKKGPYDIISLGEDKKSSSSYVVYSKYVNGYLKENPWAEEAFETDTTNPDQFVLRGDVKYVAHDPSTGQEYLAIATKVGDTEKVIMIPNLTENESVLETKWLKTRKGGTFKDYRTGVYKTNKSSTSGAKPKPPAGGGGTPPTGGKRKRFNPATGKVE